jgi:hypothetical protein
MEFNDPHHEQNALFHSQNAMHSVTSPSSAKLTRTVAIIKTDALEQRLDIEHRLLEANFEVCTPVLWMFILRLGIAR